MNVPENRDGVPSWEQAVKALRASAHYVIGGVELSREEIVHKYLHLVKYVAGRISINLPPNVEINDLINDGILGLIDAIEKYDDARGTQSSARSASRMAPLMRVIA